MTITLYSTTHCGYCRAAERLLESRNLSFEEIDCTHDQAARERLVLQTGRRTVPQIFIDEIPIGGYDDLARLDRSGELARIISGESRPVSIAPQARSTS